MKEDLQLFAQVGAHQALHVDKQVMGAGSGGRLLLAMAVLHLKNKKVKRKLHVLRRFEAFCGVLPQCVLAMGSS